MTRTRLQKILNRLDGKNEATMKVVADFDAGVKALRDKLEQDISVATLNEVNKKINQLRKSIDISPLLVQVASLREEFKQNALLNLKEVEDKVSGLREKISEESESLTESFESKTDSMSKNLKDEISIISKGIRENFDKVTKNLSEISNKIPDFPDRKEMVLAIKEVKKEEDKDIKEVKDELDKTRIDLLNRINNKGGGNMNRNIAIGGNVSVLSMYTDINLKAGNNVTITYARNNTTKYTDVTIASSGGGSSVAGTVRSINNVSTSQTMASVAGTDYVYIASAGVQLTLPSANAITNQYTIKNISPSSVLVSRDGADTIENDTNLILATQYTSVDLISDQTSNWNIT